MPCSRRSDHVLGAHVVMRRHDEMRQQRLLDGRRRASSPSSRRQLASDAVRAERAEELELTRRDAFRAPVGQVDDLALPRPSIAACGSSTKLSRPSESQW